MRLHALPPHLCADRVQLVVCEAETRERSPVFSSKSVPYIRCSLNSLICMEPAVGSSRASRKCSISEKPLGRLGVARCFSRTCDPISGQPSGRCLSSYLRSHRDPVQHSSGTASCLRNFATRNDQKSGFYRPQSIAAQHILET